VSVTPEATVTRRRYLPASPAARRGPFKGHGVGGATGSRAGQRPSNWVVLLHPSPPAVPKAEALRLGMS
jgi:hypothetical protein